MSEFLFDLLVFELVNDWSTSTKQAKKSKASSGVVERLGVSEDVSWPCTVRRVVVLVLSQSKIVCSFGVG